LCVGRAVLLGGLDVVDQVNRGVEGCVPQVEEAVLNIFDAAFSSSSEKWWQVWQERLIWSSGLLTWWSLILSPPWGI